MSSIHFLLVDDEEVHIETIAELLPLKGCIVDCDLNDLICKANKAVSKKREREGRILNVELKPYISDREREELISTIMKEQCWFN